MKRVIALAFSVALGIAVMTAGSTFAAGPEKDKPSDEATALAVKLTEHGAATFDTFNAKAMADYYLDDGEIALVTKEDGGLKVQTHKGRAEIEKFYSDVFKKPETIKSRNTVEYAKMIAPDVLVIAGSFDTNTLKPDSPKVPFYQVRAKKGDQWLMSSVRIYVLPQK
jgi:ketosteroid isomerase-like protein